MKCRGEAAPARGQRVQEHEGEAERGSLHGGRANVNPDTSVLRDLGFLDLSGPPLSSL